MLGLIKEMVKKIFQFLVIFAIMFFVAGIDSILDMLFGY